VLSGERASEFVVVSFFTNSHSRQTTFCKPPKNSPFRVNLKTSQGVDNLERVMRRRMENGKRFHSALPILAADEMNFFNKNGILGVFLLSLQSS
jgi:hypothetical protein